MTVGEVFLESLNSGVITPGEVDWVASHQDAFSRAEVATALRLGRLMDEGQVNLGCRIPARAIEHARVRVDWIEPL